MSSAFISPLHFTWWAVGPWWSLLCMYRCQSARISAKLNSRPCRRIMGGLIDTVCANMLSECTAICWQRTIRRIKYQNIAPIPISIHPLAQNWSNLRSLMRYMSEFFLRCKFFVARAFCYHRLAKQTFLWHAWLINTIMQIKTLKVLPRGSKRSFRGSFLLRGKTRTTRDRLVGGLPMHFLSTSLLSLLFQTHKMKGDISPTRCFNFKGEISIYISIDNLFYTKILKRFYTENFQKFSIFNFICHYYLKQKQGFMGRV